MEKIGDYKIVGKINAGGMATVYKGIQESLNRPVAVKVLHKQFSDDPQFVERFQRESLIIARLTHPNIIHVIDRGISKTGMPFFVMDYVEGHDATVLIKENRASVNQKLDILIQVSKALSYAHKNGVIHRDIKPANILIDKEENVLVTDFGIAQFFEDTKGTEALTQEKMIMGTPAYMSPEQQIDAKLITAASDIFSLGVVMYEMFTGARPLGSFKPPSDLNPGVPKALSLLILHCLAPQPGERPASADAVKEQLLNILQGAHIRNTAKQKAIQGVKKMEDVFILLDVIKEHRFGTVFLFRHKVQEQLMVVKRYHIPLGGYKAAKLFTSLKHSHIVNIYGVSGTKSDYIIVMEYLSGGSLAERMARLYPWQDALSIMKPVCQALSFAHKNRIVHGNLRPSNILFSAENTVKVSDFGLNEHYALDPRKENWFNTANLPKSRQTDIFTVGVILYKMLTGVVPELKGNSIVPHPVFRQLPRDVQRLCARLLTRDARLRYADVDHAIEDIASLLSTDALFQETVAMAPQAAQSARQESQAKASGNRFRPLPTAVLFFILVFAAFTYVLIQPGDNRYLVILKQFLSRVTEWFQ